MEKHYHRVDGCSQAYRYIDEINDDKKLKLFTFKCELIFTSMQHFPNKPNQAEITRMLYCDNTTGDFALC
jgi:hypothetical protein